MSTLAELEKRLQHIEDERAIERLIASYGPLVDAGEADATAGLWAADGSYDVEGWHMHSRDYVAAMVRSDAHEGLIPRGCCHFRAVPGGQEPGVLSGDRRLPHPATPCSSTAAATSTASRGHPTWTLPRIPRLSPRRRCG